MSLVNWSEKRQSPRKLRSYFKDIFPSVAITVQQIMTFYVGDHLSERGEEKEEEILVQVHKNNSKTNILYSYCEVIIHKMIFILFFLLFFLKFSCFFTIWTQLVLRQWILNILVLFFIISFNRSPLAKAKTCNKPIPV